MTPLSPLQLKDHTFTEVSVRANPGGNPQAKPHLEPEVSCMTDPARDNHWRLALKVTLRSPDVKSPFLYDLDVRIEGLVSVTDTFPEAKRAQIAFVNGLGILYGAVREMVQNITARSVLGPLCLPTLSFAEVFAHQTPHEGAGATQQDEPGGPAPPIQPANPG